MSTIYIIPTPIGNLGDITYRAIDVLKKSDKIFAEDTRISKKLLLHYGVKQKLYPYHQHNEHFVVDKIIENLLEDKQVISLVSDAGTPGISDPGYLLVTKAIERNIAVFCLPGPTALIPAVVQSGFPTNEFLFVGFFYFPVRPILYTHIINFPSIINYEHVTYNICYLLVYYPLHRYCIKSVS